MKIRNTLFENKQYFETIEKIHSSDQLSVMDAYRINRLVKKLNELNEEYKELKQKLLEQYGSPGETKGTVEIESENREAFIALLHEYLEDNKSKTSQKDSLKDLDFLKFRLDK